MDDYYRSFKINLGNLYFDSRCIFTCSRTPSQLKCGLETFHSQCELKLHTNSNKIECSFCWYIVTIITMKRTNNPIWTVRSIAPFWEKANLSIYPNNLTDVTEIILKPRLLGWWHMIWTQNLILEIGPSTFYIMEFTGINSN